MAIYYLKISIGSRLGGHSAGSRVDFIQYKGKAHEKELLYNESGHMPTWALERPLEYWHAADMYERANGRLFREVEYALPIELTFDQNRELACEFAHHLTHTESLPYTLAIHVGRDINPHCHLMISERKNDGIYRSSDQWFKLYNRKTPESKGGAEKTRRLKSRKWFDDTRREWAEFANLHLKRAGHEVRINHRSSLEIEKANAEITNLKREIERLKKKLAEVSGQAEPAGKKIGEWNIVKSGGYYRAFRRITGKLRAIYLGKNLRGAAQKIKAKENLF